MCLPNNRDLDTWYDAVYALPIAWPDVTDIDTHYFKKTSANQLLALRTQLGGEISPQWHLLHHHLWNLGPSYLNAERREELLILNRPNRPGEDVKDSVLPHSYRQEWWDWECAKNEFQNMGSVAGSKSFVDENEAVNAYSRSSAEMRLLWASRTNSPKKLTHIRMAEPPKEEERMSLMP